MVMSKEEKLLKQSDHDSLHKNYNPDNKKTDQKVKDDDNNINSNDTINISISKEKINELKNKTIIDGEVSYAYTNEKPSMFSNPFSFKGRIRRLEFGISTILYFIYDVLLEALLISGPGNGGLVFVLWIPGFYFYIAQGAKRCHDRGNSGWYQIIPFYTLWMLFGDGDYGDNSYGKNPKGINKS